MANEATICKEISERMEERCTEKDELVTERNKSEEDNASCQESNHDQIGNKEHKNDIENKGESTDTGISQEDKSNSAKSNKFTIVQHEEESVYDKVSTSLASEDDFSIDISPVALLQGTVCELERALRDSRALLKTRDEDIASLRKEVEKSREQVHKEQMKWQRKCIAVEEREREVQVLKKKLRDSEKAIEELQERIKEFESPCSESDDYVPCCSSMNEIIELKMELAKKEELLEEIEKNNRYDLNGKALVPKGWKPANTTETTDETADQHNQLKLKFLRDAFFYFMIDFHSEEQIKAILAVLAYGDQREDVIRQAYRMRQRGKKFCVKEVSSRQLSFLHEEI